jgi:hypothetical protein
MARFRGQRSAFGAPGREPNWTDGDKDGIGAAFCVGSRVWFTIRRGIITEVYYPTVDRPQVRDLEFLFANGNGFFLEEKRDLAYAVERLAPSASSPSFSRNKGKEDALLNRRPAPIGLRKISPPTRSTLPASNIQQS